MSISKKSNIVVIEITEDYKSAFYRHAKKIARNLRSVDMKELGAAVQCLPEEDVLNGYENSTRKWMIIQYEDNLFIPIALFGIQAHGRVGIPWMVATDGLKKISKFIMKHVMEYLDIMKETYDILVNFVDVRNRDSIKWLKRIGFKFDEAKPYGHKQLPFHRFYMECG